jgi:hypothetical protein
MPVGYTKVKIYGWMGSILHAHEGQMFKKCEMLLSNRRAVSWQGPMLIAVNFSVISSH